MTVGDMSFHQRFLNSSSESFFKASTTLLKSFRSPITSYRVDQYVYVQVGKLLLAYPRVHIHIGKVATSMLEVPLCHLRKYVVARKNASSRSA